MRADYPEPTGKDTGRERGSTTLKQCGWCEYASGVHRYGYCIEGTCRLLRSYSKDVHWDDKCQVAESSKADLGKLIEYHQWEIENHKKSVVNITNYIKVLGEVRETASARPPLPSNRKHTHFNLSDPIAVYIEGQWEFGEVRMGYRHHDGCVSYWLEDKGPQSGAFWGSGYAVPTVMLKGEWEYFRDNTEEYDVWCKGAYREKYNGRVLDPAPIP